MILCAALLAAAAGCGGADTGASFAYPLEAAKLTLDPQILSDPASATVALNCLEGLTRTGPDGKPVLAAAESVEVSEDGLVFTYGLRQNGKWHLTRDQEKLLGEAAAKTFQTRVTAHDFVFAMRRALDPATGSSTAPALFIIKNAEDINAGKLPIEQLGVKALSDDTLAITLESKNRDLAGVLAMPVCLPCNEIFFEAAKGRYGKEASLLLCNGPFYLSKWDIEKSLRLVRNVDSWRAGQVKPAGITFYLNIESQSAYEKLLTGTYAAAVLEGAYARQAAQAQNITLREIGNVTYALCFNCADETMQNAHLRLSLCRSFDPGVAKRSGMELTNTLVPACCTVGGAPFRQPETSGGLPDFDAAAAKSQWDAYCKETGNTNAAFTLLCLTEHENVLKQAVQKWQRILGIGLAVKVEALPEDQLIERFESGDYQAAAAPLTARSTRGEAFLRDIGPGGADNYMNLKSAAYEQTIAEAFTSLTGAGSAAMCAKAERILFGRGAAMPLWKGSGVFAQAQGVSGIYISLAGEHIFFDDAVKAD